MKYLDLYHKHLKEPLEPEGWRKLGLGGGLCNIIPRRDFDLFALIKPSTDERRELEGPFDGGVLGWTYWGAGLTNLKWSIENEHRVKYEFTPLRQNLILLMACLNDEL